MKTLIHCDYDYKISMSKAIINHAKLYKHQFFAVFMTHHSNVPAVSPVKFPELF